MKLTMHSMWKTWSSHSPNAVYCVPAHGELTKEGRLALSDTVLKQAGRRIHGFSLSVGNALQLYYPDHTRREFGFLRSPSWKRFALFQIRRVSSTAIRQQLIERSVEELTAAARQLQQTTFYLSLPLQELVTPDNICRSLLYLPDNVTICVPDATPRIINLLSGGKE